MSIEFFQTKMGHAFYEGTAPRIAKALERIAKALEAEPETGNVVARLRQERANLLNLKTTEGLSAAEWQMRTANAEAEVKRLQAEKGGVAAIFGKWPGDESDAELEAVLYNREVAEDAVVAKGEALHEARTKTLADLLARRFSGACLDNEEERRAVSQGITDWLAGNS